MSVARSVSLEPGRRFGRWRLVRALGQGAFGTTFEVVDDDGREAALKLLREPPGDELRALARVVHPAVVAPIDAGGLPEPYLVMELAPGRALSDHIEEGTLPLDRLMAVGGALADALGAVHAVGLAHGDVKPANVVMDDDMREVRLVDFGLAGSLAGGSAAYAAPEVLGSGPPSASADVYSLGLTLWAALHGAPLGTSGEELAWRCRQAPVPTAGPQWLRDLLSSMLSPGPAGRPSAIDVMDVFVANGAEIQAPTADLVRRRARAVWVDRPDVQAGMADWLDAGGVLSVVGESGSGRTHSLRRASEELSARGRSWVAIRPNGAPFGGIIDALVDPRLPGAPAALVDDPDVEAVAGSAAEALVDRANGPLAVVVDDIDQLDHGSRLAVLRLSRMRDVSLLASSPEETDLHGRSVSLTRLGPAEIAEMVGALLGDPDDAIVDAITRESQGLPAAVVDAAVGAVAGGALTWRRARWVLDRGTLQALVSSGKLVEPAVDALSVHAVRVGGLLAASQSAVPVAALPELVELPEPETRGGLRDLLEQGWAVERDGLVRCATQGGALALLEACPDRRGIHARLRDRLLAAQPVQWVRLGWHLLGAQDWARVREHGERCIAEARRIDAGEAARLASAFWRVVPEIELAGVVAEALVGDDRIDEALGVIETALDHLPASPARGKVRLIQARARAKQELWSQALDAIHSAALDIPDEDEVIAATAEVHYRAQLYGPALHAARSLCSGPPPEEEGSLGKWLHFRTLWAQSALEVEGPEAAIEVLADVPSNVGESLKERSLLEGVRGRILWHAGQIRKASAAFELAAGSESQLGTRERARLHNNAGLAWYRAGSLNRAIASWEQGLLLFERLGDELDQIRVLVNLCQGLREAGRWERGRQAGAAAVDLARGRGVREFELVALGNLGDLSVATGELDEAEALFARAAMLAEAVDDHASLAEIARRRAEMAAVDNRSDALSLARTAARAATDAGVSYEVGRAEVLEAVALAREHRDVDLDEILVARTEALRVDGAAAELAWVRRWMAEAYLASGRVEDAVDVADKVVAWAEEIGHVQLRRDADSVVARARARGRRSEVGPLQRLVQYAAELVRIRDLDELLPRIAEAALGVVDVERAFVLVMDDEGEPVVRACAAADSAVQSGPSLSVVRRALTRRRDVLAADLEERADLRDASSVLELDLRAALCVPLLDGQNVLGAIYVDSSYSVADTLGDATANLRVLAAIAASSLADAHRAEAQRRCSRHTAEIVHDVRGPLTSMALTASMILAEEAAEPWVLSELPALVQSVQRARDLLDRALENNAGWGREEVDVRGLLDDLVVQFGPQARAAGVVFSRHGIDRGIVVGDRTELARAVANLMSNAVRYAPSATQIDVGLERDVGQLRVVIRDRGEGLPADPERLLARGLRGPLRGGHGLGLSIAARVAEEHGGKLLPDNAEGGGARMVMVLPSA